jgi:hypothetical protein
MINRALVTGETELTGAVLWFGNSSVEKSI